MDAVQNIYLASHLMVITDE